MDGIVRKVIDVCGCIALIGLAIWVVVGTTLFIIAVAPYLRDSDMLHEAVKTQKVDLCEVHEESK